MSAGASADVFGLGSNEIPTRSAGAWSSSSRGRASARVRRARPGRSTHTSGHGARCEGLNVVFDADLTMYVYTADPGTRSADALALLGSSAATTEAASSPYAVARPGDLKAGFPARRAATRRGPQLVGRQPGRGDQPGDHGVRVPHLPCLQLVAPPYRRGHDGHQVEEPACRPGVGRQPAGLSDGVREIRDLSPRARRSRAATRASKTRPLKRTL